MLSITVSIVSACTASITSPSNAIVDAGQYESFTATQSSCVSTFTYNVLVVNSVTPGTITHNDLLTGQTANSVTFTFQTVRADIPNSPEEANVVITDSGTNTVTSGYSSNFIINPALSAGVPLPSNTAIDNGQYSLLQSQASGGTLPYTYQWYYGTSQTCSADTLLGATTANYLVNPSTVTYYCYKVTDSATTNAVAYSNARPIVVYPDPTASTPEPSGTALDLGQSVTYNTIISGGSYPANVAEFNGATSNVVTALVHPYGDTQGSTFTAWIYPETLASSTYGAVIFGYQGWLNDHNNALYYYTNENGNFGGGTLTQNKWEFVAVTITTDVNPTIVLYINGNEVATQSFTGTTGSGGCPNDAENVIIGHYSGTCGAYTGTIPFNGMIADAQVYNATLTNAEVNAIYEGGIGGAPVAPANLIGWWKLNGTINGNVIDYSGQNNEGTPTAITYASPTNAPYGSFTVNLINTVSGQANTLIGQDDGIVTFGANAPTSGSQSFYVVGNDLGVSTVYPFSSVTNTITVNPALTTPTISPSNPTIDSGQSVTFSSTWTGGTSTYGASLYSSSTSTCNQQSTLVQQDIGLSSTTVTFSPVTPSANTYYCVYVTDNTLNTYSISNSITSDFSIPEGTAFSPSGTYAYVTNCNTSCSGAIPDNVVIINTVTNTVVNSITAGFYSPYGVSFSPSGTYAYVPNLNSNNVVIINTATNTVVNSVTSGFSGPLGVSFSPSGAYAYVTNYNSNNVVIINTATNTVVTSITSGFSTPFGVSFSPSGTYAYVTNAGSGNLVIINTATNTVTGSVTPDSGGFGAPSGVSFSPSGTYAYMVNTNSNNVIIINTGVPIENSTNSYVTLKPATNQVSNPYAGGSTGFFGTLPGASTTATSTTSTVSTTSSSTSIPVTIPVIRQSTGITSQLCNDTAGYYIVYSSMNATFHIMPGIKSCINMSANNATSKYLETNRSILVAINYSISNSSVSSNVTIHYPCSVNYSGIYPSIFRNGTWQKIHPFTLNVAACTVTFAAPADPVIALFNSLHSNSTTVNTTTLPQTTTSTTTPSQNFGFSLVFVIIVIIIIVVIVAIFAYLRSKR